MNVGNPHLDRLARRLGWRSYEELERTRKITTAVICIVGAATVAFCVWAMITCP